MSTYKFKLINSLEKVAGVFPENLKEYTHGSMLKNEQYSFQAVMYADMDEWYARGRVEIDSPIKEYITLYSVGNVPCMHTHYPNECADDDFISKTPCVLPDPLYIMADGKYELFSGGLMTLWLAVEPRGEVFGTFDINIKIYDKDDNVIKILTHTVDIIDCDLPEQTLITTGWFHGDAIASAHNVEIGSDEYWALTEKYLKEYTRFGYNTILTPIFTPPLDTDVGAERMTNQLIDVTVTDGKYEFGFDRLGYWIDLCHKYGVKNFEISHLFTQWGAEFTPKIMATVDGEYKRIFGWDVGALSDEYTSFLDEFLPLLVEYLKKKNVYDNCYFHISDEPNKNHLEHYAKVSELVRKHVGFDRMIEALSNYEFYENGLVNIPIPSNDHINAFLDNNVENLWTYYCCCQGNKVANRLIAMPSYRNRVLGCQLYKYNIKGFLHWGFNFWLSLRARKPIDPYYATDSCFKGDDAFPAGDAFSIYPIIDGENPVPSLRLFVFNEGLQDMRALELLEKLTDRNMVDELLSDINRFDTYPRQSEFYIELRNKINKLILNNIR